MQVVKKLKPVVTRPANNANVVSIADLAQFVEFDPADAKRFETSVPCVAFDALYAEYGKFEMEDGESDYYDGFWMTFKDGSTIKVYS